MKFFKLKENQTDLKTETLAGLSTFSAMMYILVVNPAILSEAGMDRGAVLAATILSSAIMTLSMGVFANLPLALAPGMGLNAFFTYTLCMGRGLSWEAALGLVFYSGLLFTFLSFTPLRKKMIHAIPHSVRKGLIFGIGFFITFIGLKNSGMIVASPATLVTLGKFSDPSVLLAFFGVILAAVLHLRKIPGSLLISILVITLGNFALGKASLPDQFISMPPSISPTFMKLDLKFFWDNIGLCLPLLTSLFFVDFFDNMGTLIGVTSRAKLVDEKGEIRNGDRALKADAFAAMVGSLLGTSSVMSYIESAVGVEQGGRTGVVSVVVAICFLGSLFLSPLLLSVPLSATTPALVMVGVFMMSEIRGLDLDDLTEAVPAFVTMIMIPLSFSISEGLGLGLVAHSALRLLTGKLEKKDIFALILSILFLIFLVTNSH